MTDEFQNPTVKRQRAALVIALLGLLLIMWAWGSWMYRASTFAATAAVTATGAEPRAANPAQSARLLSMFLLVLLILALVVIVGGYAVVRAGRRIREPISERMQRSTASDDVWQQHKLPPQWDEDDE